jgi:hypothetical protein
VASALNPVERALKRVFAELDDAGVPCALIGGLAVSARAEPRTTRDVDVAISTDGDAAAELLVFHLQSAAEYAFRTEGMSSGCCSSKKKRVESRRCQRLEAGQPCDLIWKRVVPNRTTFRAAATHEA